MNKKATYLILIFLVLLSCKEEPKISANGDGIVFYRNTHVTLTGGELYRIDDFPSKNIKPRNVDIWLPDNYDPNKKYAVLYMHDGQMLFDANLTWNKQEWNVDGIGSELIRNGDVKEFLVVAIWNIQELRNSNYFPKSVYELMSQKDKDSLYNAGKERGWINTINSDDYLKFIVEELKPFVDGNFSTLPGPGNTVIMGSSRGGLISMYAISEHPEVFGGAACLSTHWIGTYSNEDNQIPDAFLEYMSNNLPDSKNHKLYFDYGTETLDALYLPYQTRVNAVLKTHGYDTNLRFEGHDHSEESWQDRLDVPLKFLLNKRSNE
jgi:predicted alpha/beta superfamily hydrolase